MWLKSSTRQSDPWRVSVILFNFVRYRADFPSKSIYSILYVVLRRHVFLIDINENIYVDNRKRSN